MEKKNKKKLKDFIRCSTLHTDVFSYSYFIFVTIYNEESFLTFFTDNSVLTQGVYFQHCFSPRKQWSHKLYLSSDLGKRRIQANGTDASQKISKFDIIVILFIKLTNGI